MMHGNWAKMFLIYLLFYLSIAIIFGFAGHVLDSHPELHYNGGDTTKT